MVGNWITCYLTECSQFIHVGSEFSVVIDCSCGMPQESVLGPLFFVTYISPVAYMANKFGVFLSQYADDKQQYVALSKKAVTKLQNCQFDIHAWSSQNGLVINLEKSEAVLLSTTYHVFAAYRCEGGWLRHTTHCQATGCDSRSSFNIPVICTQCM